MYWTEQITLLRDAAKKVQGVLVHNYEPVRTVFGEKKSVKWGEFFAAESAGTSLTAVFVLHADEYDGERVVMHRGKRYSVQRAYLTGDKVELTCSDLAQPKGDTP